MRVIKSLAANYNKYEYVRKDEFVEDEMAIYLTIFLIIAIGVGLFVYFRFQCKPARKRNGSHHSASAACGSKSLAPLQSNKFFWGAELWQPGCPPSYAMLGKQFSFTDAPEIPLADCNRKTCSCQFKGLRDRRHKPRRMHPDRRSEFRYDKTHPDRRVLSGRRRGDLWAGHAL